MSLNLKSTRHLLTAPHMQTKSTEETLILQAAAQAKVPTFGHSLRTSDGRTWQARQLIGAPFSEPRYPWKKESFSFGDDDWMSQREGRSWEPSTSEAWTGCERHDGEKPD